MLPPTRDLSIAHNRTMIQFCASASLALAAVRQGRSDDAVKLGREALTLSNDIGTRAESAHCHVAMSICRGDDARTELNEARRIYRDIGMEDFLDRLLAMPAADRIRQL